MRLNPDVTLMDAARRIAPVIREHNAEAERERGRCWTHCMKLDVAHVHA